MSGGDDGPQPERKRPSLESLPPVVRNGTFEAVGVQIGSGETATGHLDASKARIEVRVHNTGTRRAVLTSARFTINDYARIVPCGLGAGLVASARYDVVLPVDPSPGEAVEVPTSESVALGEQMLSPGRGFGFERPTPGSLGAASRAAPWVDAAAVTG